MVGKATADSMLLIYDERKQMNLLSGHKQRIMTGLLLHLQYLLPLRRVPRRQPLRFHWPNNHRKRV